MTLEIIIIGISLLLLFALRIISILHHERYNKANTKRQQAQEEWLHQQKKDFFKF